MTEIILCDLERKSTQKVHIKSVEQAMFSGKDWHCTYC